MATSLVATPTSDGLYAIFRTNKGDFTAELFYKDAPLSSANMVGLAEGTIPHYTSGSETPIYSNYYDSLTFHRIIDGFVIQGGDPLGNGMGGPGYSWVDEVHPDLKHAGEGILSMANSGANTNGSQFFVTLATTSHLDGLHNVFGRIVEGITVVRSIGATPTNSSGLPNSPVTINTLEILRIGEDANAFDPTFYATHFDPTVPSDGLASDSNTQVSPVTSGHITVSAPFSPLTEFRVLTSNDLQNWNEESHILPTLDPNSTPPEYQIDLQDAAVPNFVKIDATKRKITDISNTITEIEFESGTEASPYTEKITITSSEKGTYSLNGGETIDIDLEWFEINNMRVQLFISFPDSTYIQFYLDRSNGNQGDLFLRDNHYEWDPFYQQWVIQNTLAEGTFTITPEI